MEDREFGNLIGSEKWKAPPCTARIKRRLARSGKVSYAVLSFGGFLGIGGGTTTIRCRGHP
jgi:hypothetical protein